MGVVGHKHFSYFHSAYLAPWEKSLHSLHEVSQTLPHASVISFSLLCGSTPLISSRSLVFFVLATINHAHPFFLKRDIKAWIRKQQEKDKRGSERRPSSSTKAFVQFDFATSFPPSPWADRCAPADKGAEACIDSSSYFTVGSGGIGNGSGGDIHQFTRLPSGVWGVWKVCIHQNGLN